MEKKFSMGKKVVSPVRLSQLSAFATTAGVPFEQMQQMDKLCVEKNFRLEDVPLLVVQKGPIGVAQWLKAKTKK